MNPASARLNIAQIGEAPREVVIAPDEAGLAAVAARLKIPDVTALTCRFSVFRDRAGRIAARGTLDAVVVQDDINTLEPFAAPVHEDFALRFVPEETLAEVLDPDDPVDDVGYTGSMIDLYDAMCEQLALALDPYPRRVEG